jgi:hypothetical protein
MNPLRYKPPAPWPLIVLFIVIMISVIVAGVIYYNNQKKSLITEKQVELSVIADLKIRQITQWRNERLGDAAFLGENMLIIKKFSGFLQNPSDRILRSDILHSLRSLIDNFDYRHALILDPHGKVRLSYPLQDSLIGDSS